MNEAADPPDMPPLAQALHNFLDQELPQSFPWWHFVIGTVRADDDTYAFSLSVLDAARPDERMNPEGIDELRALMSEYAPVKRALISSMPEMAVGPASRCTVDLAQGGGTVTWRE